MRVIRVLCVSIKSIGWSAISPFFEHNRTVVCLFLSIKNQFIYSIIITIKKVIISNLMKKMSIMSQLPIKGVHPVHVHNLM
jgi:hypothetical protein